MSPVAAQAQINFACRKLSVRRKMDFDDDILTSPPKSPRKGNIALVLPYCDLVLNFYCFLPIYRNWSCDG